MKSLRYEISFLSVLKVFRKCYGVTRQIILCILQGMFVTADNSTL